MNTDSVTRQDVPQALFDIRHMTTDQLQQLGLSQLAYVRPVMMDGTPAFAIHGADGKPMAVAADRDLALAAIMQNDMLAVPVH
jgi:hypothetical protein